MNDDTYTTLSGSNDFRLTTFTLMSREYHAAAEERIRAYLAMHPELTLDDIALVEWSSTEDRDGKIIYKRHFKVVRKEELGDV